MASKNAQDGISLIQTAEGALTETHSILQRVRELVVQAGNTGTQQTEDLTAIQDEIKALKDEIDGISERTEFNGKNCWMVLSKHQQIQQTQLQVKNL